MVEYIEKYDAKRNKFHIKVKLHAKIKNFKRVENFRYMGRFYNIYVDKNDSVYNVVRTEVTSWKEIVKGKRKKRVPEAFEVIPEPTITNKVKGNPYKIAAGKIMTEIERESI